MAVEEEEGVVVGEAEVDMAEEDDIVTHILGK